MSHFTHHNVTCPTNSSRLLCGHLPSVPPAPAMPGGGEGFPCGPTRTRHARGGVGVSLWSHPPCHARGGVGVSLFSSVKHPSSTSHSHHKLKGFLSRDRRTCPGSSAGAGLPPASSGTVVCRKALRPCLAPRLRSSERCGHASPFLAQ